MAPHRRRCGLWSAILRRAELDDGQRAGDRFDGWQLLAVHDEDWDRAVVQEVVADAAEQDGAAATPTARAHDDEIVVPSIWRTGWSISTRATGNSLGSQSYSAQDSSPSGQLLHDLPRE